MGWEYADLHERLAGDQFLSDGYREEEFNKLRGPCASKAIAHAAHQHAIPFDFRRLDCNGQHKLLVKAGRVLLIQEPIHTIADRPCPAEYKLALADVHSYVRQLELDLGDQPLRIRDWSGCVLAVLLHGPVGPHFTPAQKALGAAMLAVPDSSYDHWVVRVDLHTVAMFGQGEGAGERQNSEESFIQSDNVLVTPKRKNSEKGVPQS